MASESPSQRNLNGASLPAQSKGPTPKHKFEGHKETISNFIFLHDNVHIVSGSLDCTMQKWDCNTGLLVGEPWKGDAQYIDALSLSPDGRAIACGREDGSIQWWNLEGEIKGVWTGHSDWVRSLSWSPKGDHLASGSNDGTILIRQAASGDIEVGPIETKQGRVFTLAYSPAGDRIASGGNSTICIWDTKTGLLAIGPIEELGAYVTSVVWSSDNGKLYVASDKFARVFDSTSGAQLHHFEHLHPVNSIALSPKNNVLACVGNHGIAQLWDTESLQPLGQPFGQEDHETLHCVCFSPDGRYLAYGGNDMKITLWVGKHIAPELASPSPSCLDVQVTGNNEEGHDDPYNHDNFFRSSRPPGPSSGPPRSFQRLPPSTRRFWSILMPSRRRPPVNLSIPQPRPKRSFFAWHTGPKPVTVSAGRRKNRIYVALPLSQKKNADTNTQAGQTSSTGQPHLVSNMPQHTQTQSETQPAQEDHGCWGNFCLALGCVPRRSVPSAVQVTAS